MDLGLKGKTAIITGGSGGIGQGLVLEFAREGLNVVSASRDASTGEKLAQQAVEAGFAGKVLAVATDVTDRASVDAMVATTNEAFGPVDVLINNAGGVAHMADFENFDEEGRKWEIALNIDGVVNCCQAVADDMLGRSTGSIINISSNSSLLGEAAANIVHYGGVKGFVNSFSKSLAWEWAKKGVRVNNICPGWIVPEDEADVGDVGPDDVADGEVAFALDGGADGGEEFRGAGAEGDDGDADGEGGEADEAGEASGSSDEEVCSDDEQDEAADDAEGRDGDHRCPIRGDWG